MPGLVIARRRLPLGGDEFMLPYVTCACGRMLWVLFLSVGLVLSINILLTTSCMNTGYIALGYVGASIVVGAISLVVELQIAKASTYGTIIDPGPRNKLLEKHLRRKSILGAVQLLLALLGVVLLVYVPLIIRCKKAMGMVIMGIVLTMISQFLDAGSMYCCFLAFTSPASDENSWVQDGDEEVSPHGVLAEMEMRYEEFCRKLCKWAAWCSCTFSAFGGAGQETDFAHVSRVFSRMLSARRFVDVVPTDIAAGLVLLRHVQKSEDYKRRDELMGGDGTPSYSTISKDPGLEYLYGGESDSRNAKSATHTASRGGVVANIRNVRESTSAGAQLWRGSSVHGDVLPPGSLPLQERPQKHRKYYKVSRNEKLLDLEHGGQDWQVLEEIAHFVRYANVMYSVWSTIAVDPGKGMRRIATRSGSWCPRFVTKFAGRLNKTRAPRRNRGSVSGTRIRSRQGPFGAAASPEVDIEIAMETGNLREAEIRGDNWWGSYETALRAELPEGTELVLAHFRNCLVETPYCVVLDHKWQSVVITIRGSHSFEDFLVDAMAEPRSLEDAGREWGFDGSGMHAHEGILRRAEWIRRDLEDSGVLRLLLGDGAVRDVGNMCVGVAGTAGAISVEGTRNREGGLGGSGRMSSHVPLASAVEGSGFCAGYTLRTVGHSLGGGCAALLTLLLKAAYPSVEALAVSPPGGLVSEGACREATEALVTSLVLNDDVVPRMSSQSIEVLADQVLEVLGRSRVSKLVVMRSLLRGDEDAHRPDQYLDLGDLSRTDSSLGGEEKQGWPPKPLVVGTNEGREVSETGDTGNEGVSRYHRQLRRYREHLRREHGSHRHLYHLRPPGRILRLVNTDFVMEQVDVRACDDGCLAVCCCCLAQPTAPEDVRACCCTPGRAHRKRRVFTPVWSLAKDLSEIKVTAAFLFDHSPDEIIKAMEQMLEDLGVSV